MITEAQLKIGEFILRKEGRFDSRGNLRVYRLPAGDGGGKIEVAGINDRYHPDMTARLVELIGDGEHALARAEAIEYLVRYTRRVEGWHPSPSVRSYLRDCAFNRGPRGAALIFQRALQTPGSYAGRLDGQVGPMTKRAAEKHSAEDLIFRLMLARQRYEVETVGRDESSKFWDGLVNRWVNVGQFCLGTGDPYNDLS